MGDLVQTIKDLLSLLKNGVISTTQGGSGGAAGATAPNQQLQLDKETAIADALTTGITQTTLAAILAELRDDVFVSSFLWEDRSATVSVFYREERIRSQDNGAIVTAYTRLSDNVIVATLPVGVIPVNGSQDRVIEFYRYKATQTIIPDFSQGDFLANTIVFDVDGAGTVLSSSWYNLTTKQAIASPLPQDLEDPNAKLENAIGTKAGSAATSDTGAFSVIELIKRGLTNWTSLLTRLPTSLGPKTSSLSFSATIATDDAQFGADSTGATQIGTGTGTRGWLSNLVLALRGALTRTNPWFARITDGTNDMPMGDAVSRAIFIQDLADGTVAPGVVATRSQLIGGQFNSTLPTVAATQQVAAQFDARGRLVTRGRTITANVTPVTATTISAIVLAANTARAGAKLVNNSTGIFYGLYGTGTASPTNNSFVLSGFVAGIPGIEEVPFGYEGAITGVWAAGATGNLSVTEFV